MCVTTPYLAQELSVKYVKSLAVEFEFGKYYLLFS